MFYVYVNKSKGLGSMDVSSLMSWLCTRSCPLCLTDGAEMCAQAIYDRLLVLQENYPVGGVLLPVCSLLFLGMVRLLSLLCLQATEVAHTWCG